MTRAARTTRPRATRAALMLAAATMLALPATALAAGDGLTSTRSTDDQSGCASVSPASARTASS